MSRSISAAQTAFPVPTKSRNIAVRHDYEEIIADVDEAEIMLARLRKRGSGINLKTTRPTTARMTRIIKLLGLSVTGHGVWCGFTLKAWLTNNPTWNEQQWARIVAENHDLIREVTLEALKQKEKSMTENAR